MKNILVVYYSQSGHSKQIVDGIVKSLQTDEIEIDYFKIQPISDFPYPWTSEQFFDAMPESVNGIPVSIKPFNSNKDYDLVILNYTVWFLHPSIPFWSLMQDAQWQHFIKGKKVITVLGVRNMWVNAHQRMQQYFVEHEVEHVGNLVFSDPAPNLVSVITVLQFMLSGKQKPYRFLPRFGISDYDLNRLPQLGAVLNDTILLDSYSDLQTKIVENKGVSIDFSLLTTEMTASRIFKFWSAFVLKKGAAGNPNRQFRLKIYKFYLLTLLFVLSPISSMLFKITDLLFYPITSKRLLDIKLLKKF